MQYIKFGNTGMDVSRICLGMMSFGRPGKENGVFPWAKDYEDAKPLFKKAIDLGINYFDTANVYQMGSSEEITGRLVRDFGLDRDEIVVGSSYWNEFHALTKDDVPQDPEGLQTLRNLARNMVYVMKCQKAGRDAGILPPANESGVFTNFVR